MEIVPLKIPDVLVIKPDVFADERGYFFESFQKEKFDTLGIKKNFLQDNESKSQKGVLRGLHYQLPPFAQGKLVRVIKGSVLDVAVDIRKHSLTFGKWVSVVLSEENKWMCWIPEGFAHGFISLENETIFSYKCTNIYHKPSERSILWNDSSLNINWGTETPILSPKDAEAPALQNAATF